MKANIASLPQGLTFCPDGRSGLIYFRRDDHVLELYWEMSGVDDYDILLSLEGVRRWAQNETGPARSNMNSHLLKLTQTETGNAPLSVVSIPNQ